MNVYKIDAIKTRTDVDKTVGTRNGHWNDLLTLTNVIINNNFNYNETLLLSCGKVVTVLFGIMVWKEKQWRVLLQEI